MSATQSQPPVRCSLFALVCLLAILASAISVSSPIDARADSHPDDTIQAGDTLGGGVGNNYNPPPTDPTVAPNEYLDEARGLVTQLATIVRMVWHKEVVLVAG